MSFTTVLGTIIRADENRQNILTDGQLTVSYRALPTALAAFSPYFAAHGIARNHCLAVECPTTVPGALTLLYLLQQGISFVLLPPSEPGEQVSQWKPIPHFCRAPLVIKRAPAEAEAS